MKAIILLGAPGAGKGTASERLCASTSYVHFSTGDMLRAAVKAGNTLGIEARVFMERGDLVPDAMMMAVVEERVAAGPGDASYMFDGFPRTVRQAELLDSLLATRGGALEHVFFLDAPRPVLVQRLTGRRICRACGANFHVVNMPPQVAGRCDSCGGELYQRPDDQEQTILSRLDVFIQKTEALIMYYDRLGLLRRIDSSRGADEMVNDVLRVLQVA